MMADNPRDDALAIWRASVDAVRSDALVKKVVRVGDGQLRIGPHRWSLDSIGRIEVVGAGKAGAGMAQGFEEALGAKLLADKRVDGWINVPADCVVPLSQIHLHAARPAGCNEPTEEGLVGTTEILRRVRALQPNDLCVCLISGGGSALLPAPRNGISLDDLLQITRQLSAAAATIQQLNAVRKRLSRIQGGQLARACPSKRLVTLIISDVIGDPLDVIASGPTVVQHNELAATRHAIDVLDELEPAGVRAASSIRKLLEADLQQTVSRPVTPEVFNLVIGNNQTATTAAMQEAQRLGYSTQITPTQPPETTAEEVGRWLIQTLCEPPPDPRAVGPRCWISGGEPVVKLVDTGERGRGGRNQQLVLAALCQLLEMRPADHGLDRAVILSGGTDGEDGPTDAAGALLDSRVWQSTHDQKLNPTDFLRRNDAYTFFQATDGLIRTGPTHTNVCDVRVALRQ